MKSPHEMSAQEKLLRLKELDALELPSALESYDEHCAIVAERKALLATVTLPPLHLMKEWRAPLWAEAFAAQFPSVRADDVLAWFANAINAGSRTAFEEGSKAQAAADAKAMQVVGDALETIRDGVQQGVITSSVHMTNLETGKTRTLGEYVAEALQLMGR